MSCLSETPNSQRFLLCPLAIVILCPTWLLAIGLEHPRIIRRAAKSSLVDSSYETLLPTNSNFIFVVDQLLYLKSHQQQQIIRFKVVGGMLKQNIPRRFFLPTSGYADKLFGYIQPMTAIRTQWASRTIGKYAPVFRYYSSHHNELFCTYHILLMYSRKLVSTASHFILRYVEAY